MTRSQFTVGKRLIRLVSNRGMGSLKIQETPSSLAVVGSWDGPSAGSSEPLQASSSNGRISARAKIPRKSRGVLMSIHCLCLPGLYA